MSVRIYHHCARKSFVLLFHLAPDRERERERICGHSGGKISHSSRSRGGWRTEENNLIQKLLCLSEGFLDLLLRFLCKHLPDSCSLMLLKRILPLPRTFTENLTLEWVVEETKQQSYKRSGYTQQFLFKIILFGSPAATAP